MAKGKALQPLMGSYGRVNAGDEFELREADLKELVKNGLAELVEGGDKEEEEPAKEKGVRISGPEKNKDAGPAKATKDKVPTKG